MHGLQEDWALWLLVPQGMLRLLCFAYCIVKVGLWMPLYVCMGCRKIGRCGC
jgi:hypothetical protein